MSDVSVEAKIKELSAKVDSVIFGCKMGALGLLVLFSLPNLFVAVFSIPKFRQIFQDALPGKPLPPITYFLVTFQPFVVCIACLWPLLGLLAILIPKKTSTSVLIISSLLILVVLQIGITVLALFMPMVALDGGMTHSP